MNNALIALLAGVAVGILIAPAKGSETREKLINDFNGLADKLTGAVKDVYEAEKNMVEESIASVEHIAREVAGNA